MADDWNSLQSTFGLTAQDIASLKTQGMNPNSATDFLTKGIGSNTLMQGPGGMTLSQLINLRSAFGGGGGVAQAPAKPANPGGVDPNQPEVNLGAAALAQRAVYNPTPSSGIDPVSGVSTSANTPTTSDIIPKVPKGPWTQVPSVFNPTTAMQPTAPLPVAPTRQATGVSFTPGQSWATPPPAPNLTVAPGGGAMPMPMGQPGGSPQNWQGAGQVPPGAPGMSQLTPNPVRFDIPKLSPVSTISPSPLDGGGGAGGAQVRGAQVALGTGAVGGGPGPIKHFAEGGIVTEPTLGWIGEKGPEMVIPLAQQRRRQQKEQAVPKPIGAAAQQAEQYGGAELPQPIGAAAQQGQQYAAQTNQPAGQTGRPRSSTDNSQAVNNLLGRGNMTSAQDYANWANQGGPMGGKAGAVYDANGNLVTSSGNLTAQAAAGSGATMMPGGGIRDASGLVYDSSANLVAQDVGGAGATMPGAGGAGAGGMGNAIAGGIGAIGGALQSLFSPSNIPSWKTQASAIPDPSSFKKQQPQYNFQPPSA